MMLQAMEKPEQTPLAPSLIQPARVIFDPASVEDQAVYLHFMQTGTWLKKYHVEWPEVTVPGTCQRKLLEHFLQTEAVMKTAEQLAAKRPPAIVVEMPKIEGYNTQPPEEA